MDQVIPDYAKAWTDRYTNLFTCGTQAITTTTTDVATLFQWIKRAARTMDVAVIHWSMTSRFEVAYLPPIYDKQAIEGLNKSIEDLNKLADSTPRGVFVAINELPFVDHAIIVMENFFPYFASKEIRDIFTKSCWYCHLSRSVRRTPVHFVNEPYAGLEIRELSAIEHCLVDLPMPLPSASEIEQDIIQSLIVGDAYYHDNSTTAKQTKRAVFPADNIPAVAEALKGLSRIGVTAIVHEISVAYNGLPVTCLPEVSRRAAEAIATTGTMELVDLTKSMRPDELGGVDEVLEEIEDAAHTFTPGAEAEGLEPARGLVFTGISGTGKTTLAEAAAQIFEKVTSRNWKVVIVRIGAFYGSLVGQTEAAWNDFEQKIQAMGRCVIVFDEVDKAFGGVTGGDGDSGVRKSLFGLLLSFLGNKEKTKNIFAILAMNDPSTLPPELFRRSDATFFFDFPGTAARIAILKTHFRRGLQRGGYTLDSLEFSDADWSRLADATEQWIPDEIGTLVGKARRVAFRDRQSGTVTLDEVIDVVSVMGPSIMSKTSTTAIAALRLACKDSRRITKEQPKKPVARVVGRRTGAITSGD